MRPVRRVHTQLATVPRLAPDLRVHANSRERRQGIGDQSVAAHFVTREGTLIGDDDVIAGGGEGAGRSGTGRSCAGDQHIATGRC